VSVVRFFWYWDVCLMVNFVFLVVGRLLNVNCTKFYRFILMIDVMNMYVGIVKVVLDFCILCRFMVVMM